MHTSNTLTIMLNSQNFDVTVNDDFTIFLSVDLHNTFKNTNIDRQQMLSAYVEKVYELFLQEKEIDKILNTFPQT